MKDGINEKFTLCRECGSKCNHDDDGYDLCRFCSANVPHDESQDKTGEFIK